jgi:hypothetical protein
MTADMSEEAHPTPNGHPTVEQWPHSDATSSSLTSSTMREEENAKREGNLKERAKKANRFWQDTWAPEVLSCVVALSALIGMALILSLRQGTLFDK